MNDPLAIFGVVALALALAYAFADKIRAALGAPKQPTSTQMITSTASELQEPRAGADPVALLRQGIRSHKAQRQAEEEEKELTKLLDTLSQFASKEAPAPK